MSAYRITVLVATVSTLDLSIWANYFKLVLLSSTFDTDSYVRHAHISGSLPDFFFVLWIED